MDVTYIIPAIGLSNILFNFETGGATFLLLALTNPCGNSTKYALVQPSGCDPNWIVPIEGTSSFYEDLEDGMIYFQEYGTWTVDVYWQFSETNLDPEEATFVTTVSFQIV